MKSHEEWNEESALQQILEGTAPETGERFFHSLTRHLAAALGVRYAFVAEFAGSRERVRTLAFWDGDTHRDSFEYDLSGTPCEEVFEGRMCHHPDGVADVFPQDEALVRMGVQSYLGVPLVDVEGDVLGHLAIFDVEPMPAEPRGMSIFRIFAARAAAELRRMRAERACGLSEGRYRDLYENAPVAYMSTSAQGRVLRANRVALQLFERSEEELIGQKVVNLFADTPTGRGRSRELLARFQAGEPFVDELVEVASPTRGTVWVSITVSAVRDEDGKITHSRSVVVDVTEKRRMAEALRDSEARHSGLFESAMDGIVLVDHDLRIRLFNPAAEKIFRCARGDAIGSSFERFLSPAFNRTRIQESFRTNENKEALWAPEGLTALRADGEEFPVEATISPVRLSGEVWYSIILRDVNDRRQAEDELERLQRQNLYLQEELKSEHDFEEIIGGSGPMKEAFRKVAQVAGTDATVLLTGETGTGKELFARAIHDRSDRRERPLIKLNCAALPSGLVESELFGHEKGAFTGATERRIGRFELADGGTLFLDEIGELEPEVQVRLLRVLQEQEFERVGSVETLSVDVRVIAATNRDLRREVDEGRFREDLFYRLNVFPLALPALRERDGDLDLLVTWFVEKFASKLGRKITAIEPAALARLSEYSWPGNVRELQNVLERAVILSEGDVLDVSPALTPARTRPTFAADDLGEDPSLEALQRRHILRVLERTGWRIEGDAGAAGILGLHPNTLRSRMKKLDIRRNADIS